MRTATINQLDPLEYAGTEALNAICTNLTFAGNHLKKIVFTSSSASEGKSYLVMQMTMNLARRGHRVVLVDADMRRSFLVKRHQLVTDGKLVGLAHYLTGQCSLNDCVYETNMYGACIIPAGRDVATPMSLIDSTYFSEMLDELARNFDLVLVDAPPIGMVIDAATIAGYCDGSVLVVEYNRTRMRELASCKKQMEQSGTPVLGCILNKVKFDTISAKKYYNKGYYKHYSSGYYKKEEEQNTGNTTSNPVVK
ncbi:MAG: CpsD/CapB family tyrosine-protein kinase [Clostridia bacterium]|nr:CpsD/CapB family tyrosine-protein kinase [Clostridia bacterium]